MPRYSAARCLFQSPSRVRSADPLMSERASFCTSRSPSPLFIWFAPFSARRWTVERVCCAVIETQDVDPLPRLNERGGIKTCSESSLNHAIANFIRKSHFLWDIVCVTHWLPPLTRICCTNAENLIP